MLREPRLWLAEAELLFMWPEELLNALLLLELGLLETWRLPIWLALLGRWAVPPPGAGPFRLRVAGPFRLQVAGPFRRQVAGPFRLRVAGPFRLRVAGPFRLRVAGLFRLRVAGLFRLPVAGPFRLPAAGLRPGSLGRSTARSIGRAGTIASASILVCRLSVRVRSTSAMLGVVLPVAVVADLVVDVVFVVMVYVFVVYVDVDVIVTPAATVAPAPVSPDCSDRDSNAKGKSRPSHVSSEGG